MAKKAPSTDELNKMIADLKPGESRHFPEHDMMITKPKEELPTGTEEERHSKAIRKEYEEFMGDKDYKSKARTIK